MAEKCIEKYFDMPMGCYCGVLIKETMAKKLQKLLYKQNQDIKELLASDLSQVEISNWTLAYPDGKQTSIKYFEQSTNEEKLERIKLIDQTAKVKYCENGVWNTNKKYNEARNDVEDSYMKHFND